MSNILKSILVDISSEVWGSNNLEKSKQIIEDKVNSSKIETIDKHSILNNLKKIKNKKELDLYLGNSILFFEGNSVNNTPGYKPRKSKKPSKNYFTRNTEDAIIQYNNSSDHRERSKIYEEEIHNAFFKLTENIIHTFKFYNTDVEDLKDLQHELIIFLLSKIHLFNHRKNIQDRFKKIISKEFKETYNSNFEEYVGNIDRVSQEQIDNFIISLDVSDGCREKLSKITPPKAYSYFGTIVKRWLIVYNDKNYQKKIDKTPLEDLEQDEKFSDELNLDNFTSVSLSSQEKLSNFVDLFTKHCTDNIYELFPEEEDSKIADAILELFRKRNHLMFFNKKALYIYIREMVSVKTPKITSISDRMKKIFKKSYSNYIEYGYIKF